MRLYEDQIEKLEMIVSLGNGREDRSRLIREGIDMVIAQRLHHIVKNAPLFAHGIAASISQDGRQDT